MEDQTAAAAAPPNPDDALIAYIAELDLERRRAVRELQCRQVEREMQRRGLLPPDDASLESR